MAPRPLLLLLFPAHSYRVEAFLAAADRLGADIALGTDLPGAFLRHGRPVHEVDFSAPERSAAALAAAAERAPFAGVLATNEPSAVVAALVAERLGLPHATPAGARAARDKRLLREALASAGVPGASFRMLEPHEAPEGIAAQLAFPCVVKPPMLTGSQGVIRADDPAAFARAVHRVRAILASHPGDAAREPDFHRLLVEEYLPGKEVALEALVTRGELRPLALFDKPDDLTGPYFEETLYVTPSRLPLAQQAHVVAVAARAARALGLDHGPVHAELRVDGDRVSVLEIAARSIGGLCSRVFQLIAGPLEDVLIAHAAGLPLPAPVRGAGADAGGGAGAAGVMMMPIPRSGVLRRVSGLEEARAVPGIEQVTVALSPGEAIRALPEGASYLGFIFAHGPTPEAVERSLRASFGALRFELSPLLDVLARP